MKKNVQGEKSPIMTRITRFFKKFITFMFAGAVLVTSTAFAFADDGEAPSMGVWYSLDNLASQFIVSNEDLTYTFINPTPIKSGNLTYVWTGIQIGYSLPGSANVDYTTPHALTLKYELDLSSYGGAVYLCNRQVNESSIYSNFPSARKFDMTKVVEYENCDLSDNQIIAIDPTKPVTLTVYEPNFTATKLSTGGYSLRYPFGFSTKAVGNGTTFTARLIGLDYGGYNYASAPAVVPTYYSYKFNVPSGQMLHILADNIQSVYVKYNMGLGLFRSSSLTMNANRYNYAVSDYANTQAFSTSNVIQWQKVNNSTYQMDIDHDNSNSLNFYNFMIGDNERVNNYEVYITCSTARAYMYSQDWRGHIVESTSSSGAIFFGGGNGTVDSPYDAQLYNADNTTIYKPSTLEVDTSAQDGAMQAIVNALSMPGKFIQTVQDSTGEFMKTISTLYSWLPVELTSVIVGAFSVIIAVGVLKMFL